MWSVEQKIIEPDKIHLVSVLQDAEVLAYSAVLDLWISNAEFCDFFSRQLASCPFKGFRWETPPVTSGTIARPFQFALVNSPYLCVAADVDTFAQHFADSRPGGVTCFKNLSGDAILIAPCPDTGAEDYAHLGAFLRHAPTTQSNALWSRTGQAVNTAISDRPLWLSTAGDGVAWLHVRLDQSPKYYRYMPFRN